MTAKSIQAMTSITELGLITKQALCELVYECSSFLVHPGLWIRQALAGFISTAARTLSMLDVQCKIMPHLSVYMKYPLIQIDRYLLYYSCLLKDFFIFYLLLDQSCYWNPLYVQFQELFTTV